MAEICLVEHVHLLRVERRIARDRRIDAFPLRLDLRIGRDGGRI